MPENKIDNIERAKRIEDMDFSSEEVKAEILNVIEMLCKEVIDLRIVVQGLRDEVMRLKGEKGKPEIKANKEEESETEPEPKSGMEKGEKKPWKKGSKKDKIKIDRTVTVELDKTGLPEDIEFKGYEERIVQNIIIKTDNVLYRLEKYYSLSEGKTYIAKMEENLQDTEFGPETKALVATLYYENRVTENKIASFLNSNGLYISEGTISNILIKDKSEELTAEKQEIFNAGLRSATYQQIDDTGMRIAGKNGYATIVCNENYSAFFINLRKNRDTIKEILGEEEVELFLILLCDDAPQFKKIAKALGLCWVHEERHYVT